MPDADVDYCLRRADEERERAASSDDQMTADRHRELARLYELRARDPVAWSTLSTQKSA